MKLIIIFIALLATPLLTISVQNVFANCQQPCDDTNIHLSHTKKDTSTSDSGPPITQKEIDHPKTIHIPGQSKQCTLDGFCGAKVISDSHHSKHHDKTVSHTTTQPTLLEQSKTINSNPINITGIMQSASAWADIYGSSGVNDVNTAGFWVLDLCTPYSVKGGGSLINQTTGASFGSCASFLGMLKTACQSNNAELFKFCTDPRYTNWLINDYGAYPAGTWDYQSGEIGKLITP
jgi:hypothetical protein